MSDLEKTLVEIEQRMLNKPTRPMTRSFSRSTAPMTS